MFIFHDNNLRFMPLSGVFFVSLHHQSNRMTMFKKTDPNPQLDIFTAPSMQLGSRASKKYSDPNAWHNQFYSLVTTKIDEEIFKPLFPEGKKCGRPNASIRILVAMSVLKEGFGCSDEDLFEKCEFDLLTRKALGMELLTDVTPSIDTYYLFRRRICEYQERTGIDLMQISFEQLAGNALVVAHLLEARLTDQALRLFDLFRRSGRRERLVELVDGMFRLLLDRLFGFEREVHRYSTKFGSGCMLAQRVSRS